jgi:hypothetical protein
MNTEGNVGFKIARNIFGKYVYSSGLNFFTIAAIKISAELNDKK